MLAEVPFSHCRELVGDTAALLPLVARRVMALSYTIKSLLRLSVGYGER
jgi:hypothetical protein